MQGPVRLLRGALRVRGACRHPHRSEQGIDVSFAQFRGFIAPGGISDEAREYWIAAAKEHAETDEYATYIEDNLMQPNIAYGDDFVTYLEDNNEDLKAVLQ